MQTVRAAIISSLLALALLPAAALAEPDRSGTVSEATATFAWDGALASGYNTARDPAACSHNPDTYCDQTLIKVDTPAGSVGELKVTTGEYFGPHCTPLDGQSAPCDFSLWLYRSDASGKPGANIGSSINDSGEDEEIVYKKATPGYYLVIVYYYTVAQSSYKGTATLSKVTLPPAPAPPAVTAPPAATTLPASGTLKATVGLAGAARVSAGIPVLVGCTVICKGTVVAELSAAQARKLKLGRRKLIVARATVSVSKPEGQHVMLKVSKRAAKKLARAKRLKLTLRAAVTDASRGKASAARMVAVGR